MKKVLNPVTGKTEVQFTSTLLSINDELTENSNGTMYARCTVEFKNQKGEIKKSTAIIYENNFKHGVEVGQKYLTTANKGNDGNVYLRMSHLLATETPDVDDFNFDMGAETPSQEIVTTMDMGLEHQG